MTILSESRNASTTGWKRLFVWLQALEEALDYDPSNRAIGDLNRKVSELEKAVSDLNARPVSEPGSADLDVYQSSATD